MFIAMAPGARNGFPSDKNGQYFSVSQCFVASAALAPKDKNPVVVVVVVVVTALRFVHCDVAKTE